MEEMCRTVAVNESAVVLAEAKFLVPSLTIYMERNVNLDLEQHRLQLIVHKLRLYVRYLVINRPLNPGELRYR